MCNSQNAYHVDRDFWIYGAKGLTKHEVANNLLEQIRIASNLPDSILSDMIRGLQKIEVMSEKDFEENNSIFSNNNKIDQINEAYSDYIELEKKDFWRNG
jgi:hypothetical protein